MACNSFDIGCQKYDVTSGTYPDFVWDIETYIYYNIRENVKQE